jgi:hypothetical protein
MPDAELQRRIEDECFAVDTDDDRLLRTGLECG